MLPNMVYVAQNQYVNSGYMFDYLLEKCERLCVLVFCKKELSSSKLPSVIVSYYRGGSLYKEVKIFSYLLRFLSACRILHPMLYLGISFVIFYQFIKYRISQKEKTAFFSASPVFSIAGLFLRLFRIASKTFFYLVDYKGRETSGNFFTKIYSISIGFCASLCLKFCDVRAVIHKKILEKKKISRNIPIVPHGTRRIQKGMRKKSRPEGITICYCGVISREVFGLELIPGILKKCKYIRFEIVGSGKGSDTLKKTITSDRAVFHGYMPESERNGIFLRSDIGWAINTSYTARFSDPSKIKDYLSYGLPVIANVSQAAAFTLQEYGVGVVLKKITAKNILAAVDRIISNRGKYGKGIEMYNKDFEYHKMLDRLFLQ